MREKLVVNHPAQLSKSSKQLLFELLEDQIEIFFDDTNLEKIPPFHILVEGKPTLEQIQYSQNLETLIIPYAGLASETRNILLNFPHIHVHNLHHNAIATAEYAVALLLTIAKQIIPFDTALRINNWLPRYQPNPSIMLHGKLALILGFGHIGQHIAKILQGFGMQIMAIRNSHDKSLLVEVHSIDALKSLLPRADVLFISLPLTPDTKNLLDAEEFALLRSHVIVINIGRAEIINQFALYNALRERKIAAAGLDVWYRYPQDESLRKNTPPADYPFNKLDNIVLSPHRAGGLNSEEIEKLRITHLADLLNKALHDEPLPNRVDVIKGY